MQTANRVQRALRAGAGASFGAWQMLPGTNHARVMARSGYDWVCVDTEHGNIDDGAMHEAVSAIAACGVSPLVRVAGNESWMIKRALDAGAHGIIVPLLRTADDARRAVSFAKFPPLGERGYGSPFSMQTFGNPKGTDYLQQANDNLLTIVQIETREALQNVDAIAKVPGVDVLFVGPYDLGNNIGHPILDGTMHPNLKQGVAKVLKAAIDNDKRAGFYCTSGRQAREYAEQGFHLICVMADVVALPQALSSALAMAKGRKAAP